MESLKKGYYKKPNTPQTAHLERIEPEEGTEAVYLTDEERKMPLSKIQERFGISKSSSSLVRRRGWISKGRKRIDNILEQGGLPEDVAESDLISDVRIAVTWAVRRLGIYREFDDAVQEAFVELLRFTASEGFKNPEWRKKVAYRAALDYIFKKVFKYSGESASIDDDFNEPPVDGDRERIEQHLDAGIILDKISEFLSDVELEKLKKWMKNNRHPSAGVKKILEKIKNRLVSDRVET